MCVRARGTGEEAGQRASPPRSWDAGPAALAARWPQGHSQILEVMALRRDLACEDFLPASLGDWLAVLLVFDPVTMVFGC